MKSIRSKVGHLSSIKYCDLFAEKQIKETSFKCAHFLLSDFIFCVCLFAGVALMCSQTHSDHLCSELFMSTSFTAGDASFLSL